jgi:hypothetical protein
MPKWVYRRDRTGAIESSVQLAIEAPVTDDGHKGLSVEDHVRRLTGPGETADESGSRRAVYKDGSRIATIEIADKRPAK